MARKYINSMKSKFKDIAKRTGRSIGLRLVELKDKFRRRRTEEPHLAGFFHKSQVLIEPATLEIGEKGEYFRAKFIQPRLGKVTNPYPGHQVGIGLEVASYQTAVSGLKKFRGVKETVLASHNVQYSNKANIPSGAGIIMKVTQVGEDKRKKISELHFHTIGVDEKTNRIYFEGNFSILAVPKAKGSRQ